MKYCPISYEPIIEQEYYSKKGLHFLSPQLNQLYPLQLSAAEQRQEAIIRAGKMSIQGIQSKLSAQLKIKAACFEIVDQQGHYILKTQSSSYPELPENEALTMSLSKTIGLEVPIHGLVYAKDHSMTYFIKRFDRVGHKKKLAVEDFAQLAGEDRDTKYKGSMEKIVAIIEQFCTFPQIEFVKLFKLTLFNFLIGNEDMHLKNFSLITKSNITTLSPFYDLLNSSIAINNPKEELALPLNGRKNNLRKRDFFDYFAMQRLGLNQYIIEKITQEIQQAIPKWNQLIRISFLSAKMKEKYLFLLENRCKRLGFSFNTISN